MNHEARILIADDDVDLLALVSFALRNAGFDVIAAKDGLAALEAFSRNTPALLILDINMPGLDGFTVCNTVRATSTVPIMMLTARHQESDMIRALDCGADGYVIKPFSPRTLIARVRALLRRHSQELADQIATGEYRLRPESQSLTAASRELQLTRLETRVLQTLMGNAGRTVSAQRLAQEAWGRAGPEERHALKQVIYRLRRKLEDDLGAAVALHTKRNAGYQWSVSPSSPATADTTTSGRADSSH